MPDHSFRATVLALVLAASTAAAQPSPDAGNGPAAPAVIGAEPSNWRLGLALGYGVRSNPLIQSDDIPVVVDVDIAWFGERFFFDNGDVGLTLADNDRFTLSLIGRFNSDRVFFGKTDTRFVTLNAGTANQLDLVVEVPDRDYAIDAGAELLADGDWGSLQLTAFGDVSATHEGYELAATYSIGWRRQRWYFQPSIGVSYKSADLNDYYWGVAPAEANELLAAYQPGAGTNASLRLLGSYQLSAHWSVSVAAEFERLNRDAAGSPLVRDDMVSGFFAGFGYRF